MQTLNLLDNRFSEFNAFSVFNANSAPKDHSGLRLIEQLQTSLEIDVLLNKFSVAAARYVDFSGLKFTSSDFKATARGSRPGKHITSFELVVENTLIGKLFYSINRPLAQVDYDKLKELHHYLLYPLKNAIAYQSALKLAMQDGLTKLGNRRYYDEQLQRMLSRAFRYRSELGFILGDLNKFKAINDTHGHMIGDEVLIHFASALKSSVRNSDSVFRLGGDEFAILVEDASKEALMAIESRIINAILGDKLLMKYNVTCSLGATFLTNEDDAQSLYDRADKALYDQKSDIHKTLTAV